MVICFTSGNLTVSGTTELRGNTDILGALTVTGDISNRGDIETSGNVFSRGNVNAVNVYATTAITGETLNVTTLSGQNGIINNLLLVSGYVGSGLVVSGDLGTSGDLTVDGSGLFQGTVTGETADFTFVYGRNLVSGVNLSGDTASIGSGNFGNVGIETLNVYNDFNVPFGTTAAPGLGFNNTAVTGVFDGIMCEQVGAGSYSTMTFVNQNASGMTMSSGTNGFIITIWGA